MISSVATLSECALRPTSRRESALEGRPIDAGLLPTEGGALRLHLTILTGLRRADVSLPLEEDAIGCRMAFVEEDVRFAAVATAALGAGILGETVTPTLEEVLKLIEAVASDRWARLLVQGPLTEFSGPTLCDHADLALRLGAPGVLIFRMPTVGRSRMLAFGLRSTVSGH